MFSHEFETGNVISAGSLDDVEQGLLADLLAQLLPVLVVGREEVGVVVRWRHFATVLAQIEYLKSD